MSWLRCFCCTDLKAPSAWGLRVTSWPFFFLLEKFFFVGEGSLVVVTRTIGVSKLAGSRVHRGGSELSEALLESGLLVDLRAARRSKLAC